MTTKTMVPFARATFTYLLIGGLSTLALSGCYLESDNKNSSDKEIAAPAAVTLATREDVIQAVATVWNFAGPWAQATAPARETAPEVAASGGAKAEEPITEDCITSGSVTYDETAMVTSYDDCTETTETTDDTTGVTVTETSVIDGIVNEACILEEGESEAADHRCLNAAPLDFNYDKVTTTPAADVDSEPTSVAESLELRQDAYLEVFDETDTGYRLLVSEERRQKSRSQDEAANQASSEANVSTEGFEVRMQNTGDAETPAYGFDFNGEAFFENDGANCSAGQLRIGSASPITVDSGSGLAPTGGILVLSTDEVAALAVSFAEDRSISFRLNGQDLTATAEELSQACLGSYRIPDDTSPQDPPPGDEICLFEPICIPGGF